MLRMAPLRRLRSELPTMRGSFTRQLGEAYHQDVAARNSATRPLRPAIQRGGQSGRGGPQFGDQDVAARNSATRPLRPAIQRGGQLGGGRR